MPKPSRNPSAAVNDMASALFSSFAAPTPVRHPAPADSDLADSSASLWSGTPSERTPHGGEGQGSTVMADVTPRALAAGASPAAPETRAPSLQATRATAPSQAGPASAPRRNRAAPDAKRRRETVILSETERRPIVSVAESMAATKPGASFSEAARFLLAIGEQVLAARPDAYARLERTPPAGWAALARELARAEHS